MHEMIQTSMPWLVFGLAIVLYAIYAVGEKTVKDIPNLITTIRIIGSVCLCFIDPMTAEFYMLYTLCGISDVLDGMIARATHCTSEKGAKLDSMADLIFYAVMLCKIMPVLLECMPNGIWHFLALILVVRLSSYLLVAIKFHRFAAQHTYANKVCGLSVFLIPYILILSERVTLCYIVCALAMYAAVEELLLHILQKEYEPDRKSIFSRK